MDEEEKATSFSPEVRKRLELRIVAETAAKQAAVHTKDVEIENLKQKLYRLEMQAQKVCSLLALPLSPSLSNAHIVQNRRIKISNQNSSNKNHL